MGNKKTIVIHYGEIGLKGKNRPDFEYQLQQNIKLKLETRARDLEVSVTRGYLYIDKVEDEDINIATKALGEVTGIVWFAVTYKFDLNTSINEIEEHVLWLANKNYKPEETFAIHAHRANKTYELNSHDLEVRLGKIIQDKSEWMSVNLSKPDQIFYIDIHVEGIYIYSEKQRGLGGLPVGSSGRVLSLLSGGIDSPVASYLLAKRGAQVDFMHFVANKMQLVEAHKYKVSCLAAKLSRYTLYSRLHLVPYVPFQMSILENKINYELIIFRRFMLRVAERLSLKYKIQAVVTGDNLGQVASQTLPNLVSASKAINIPILKPLIGYDKVEIIELSNKIGTYKLSIEPYKDCCSIVSRHPRTRSNHDELTQIETEAIPKYEELMEETLNETITLTYQDGELIK